MPGPLTLGEIASRLGGRVAGDPRTRITQVGSLERAGAGQITFLSSPRYKTKLATTCAAAVILGPEMEGLTTLPRIVCEHPYAYFARLSQLFNPLTVQAPGVHPSAVVAPTARLGKRISIGPHCVVGDGAAIGDDSCLYPGVSVYPGCLIGARAIVHAGAVIGADGFGIAREGEGWVKIPQIGRVVIGDDVEIGANTTVDRGSVDDTVVGAGTKIDNLVQIAHNVHVGERCLIAAMAGIAGSTHVGDEVFLGGQVGIADHVTIGSGVRVTVQGGVIGNLPDGVMVTGMPARDHKEFMRAQAALYRLAKIVRELETLVHEAHGAKR